MAVDPALSYLKFLMWGVGTVGRDLHPLTLVLGVSSSDFVFFFFFLCFAFTTILRFGTDK